MRRPTPPETARPLRMAAVIPAGGSEVQRFGVQYSDADTADLFQQAYTILVEALSSANQPEGGHGGGVEAGAGRRPRPVL